MELKTLFKDTADAIREKDGTTNSISAKDFPARIRAMRGIELVSIEITSPPVKTSYYAGESFDPTGMVVTGYYRNGPLSLSGIVTGYMVSPAGAMAFGTTTVVITYAEGGVVKTCEQAVSVVRRAVAVPTHSGGLTYNGQPQTPDWAGYNSSIMTKMETPRTNAGSYDTTFSLIDPALYEWTDGSTTDKTVKWSIAKTAGSLSLSATAVSLNSSAPSREVIVTRDGDGSISATSSDISVATVSVSGDKLMIRSVGKTSGTAVITVRVAEGTNHTAPSDKKISVTAKFAAIYGVSWDGSSTTKWTRTDESALFTDPVPAVSNGTGSSPFDGLMPWAGMVKEEDPIAGTLVKIPKFWYKFTESGNTLKLQIADEPAEGYHVSPAHANRGDGKGERDFVYVGRYHCASGYKSVAGIKPKVSITRSAARTGIHNLGATIWQFDYAMRVTIQMLYLVEFADWNSQAKIGLDGSNDGAAENNGKTDGMRYHTGTTAETREYVGSTQYRNIERLWGNGGDWMDGCYNNDSGMNIIMNPANFSDSSGGILIGKPYRVYGSYVVSAIAIPTASGLEWAIYPKATSSDSSYKTYISDEWLYLSSYKCPYCGGRFSGNLNYGLFYVGCEWDTLAQKYITCRLQKLP